MNLYGRPMDAEFCFQHFPPSLPPRPDISFLLILMIFDVINLTEDFSPDGQHSSPAVSLSP